MRDDLLRAQGDARLMPFACFWPQPEGLRGTGLAAA
jgi:hypothetical protein